MFKQAKVGEVVVVVGSSGEGCKGRITTKGRKWFEVDGHYKFDITNGRSSTNYTWPQAVTVSQYEKDQEVERVEKLLRARFDIRFEYGNSNRSENILAMYEATKHLLEEPCPTPSK